MFSPNNSVSCFNITIIDDNVFEDPESFSVSLYVHEGSPATSSTIVNIEDNDGMSYRGWY